jgi:hypothetical protein
MNQFARNIVTRYSEAVALRVAVEEEMRTDILVDLDGESQCDLLGNSGTAPVGITPFHFNDGVDEFFVRSLRAGPPAALGREQHVVLSFHQHVVEMQQSGRLQKPRKWHRRSCGCVFGADLIVRGRCIGTAPVP